MHRYIHPIYRIMAVVKRTPLRDFCLPVCKRVPSSFGTNGAYLRRSERERRGCSGVYIKRISPFKEDADLFAIVTAWREDSLRALFCPVYLV